MTQFLVTLLVSGAAFNNQKLDVKTGNQFTSVNFCLSIGND